MLIPSPTRNRLPNPNLVSKIILLMFVFIVFHKKLWWRLPYFFKIIFAVPPRSRLRHMDTPLGTPVIHYDNQSTVALTHNLVLHSRTKHMELDIFFVHEKVLNQSLYVTHILATDQIAYLLTKPLSRSRFCLLRDKLNVIEILQSP